jgi:hypothetical protein
MRLLSSLLVVLAVSSQLFAGQIGQNKFPDGPDPVKTPGTLCDRPSEIRYPEKIKYCHRSVESSLKNRIINEYDRELGFDIKKMNRGDFKIDHFIPLSIGGSNNETNLWPQHKSVFKYSDPLESKAFELLQRGKIKQVEAIRVIKECKLNLGRCEELDHYLKSMY